LQVVDVRDEDSCAASRLAELADSFDVVRTRAGS
jgi:hypothetical protein